MFFFFENDNGWNMDNVSLVETNSCHWWWHTLGAMPKVGPNVQFFFITIRSMLRLFRSVMSYHSPCDEPFISLSLSYRSSIPFIFGAVISSVVPLVLFRLTLSLFFCYKIHSLISMAISRFHLRRAVLFIKGCLLLLRHTLFSCALGSIDSRSTQIQFFMHIHFLYLSFMFLVMSTVVFLCSLRVLHFIREISREK